MSAGLSVSGLVSGIDTNQIVTDLMRVERIPITSMQRRQTEDRTALEAYSRVTTKVSAVRDSIANLGKLSDFASFAKAASSNESVGVTVNGPVDPGSVTFTVDQLARQHQVASATGLTSGDASVGAGTFTINVGGVDHDITTTAGTSLSDLANSINELGVGINASVLQVTGGDFRLVTTSEETGQDSTFSVSATSANMTSYSTLSAGQNAQLTLGDGAGALTIERSSNTISDLIDGVDIEVASVSASPVTVSTSRDIDAAVESITGIVTAVNEAIATAKYESRWEEEGDGGALNGSSTIRDLVTSLQSVLSQPVAGLGGNMSYASAMGITLERDGDFDLDAGALRTALENDFDGVASFFAKQGTPTDTRVSFADSDSDTLVGDYAIEITQAATIATTTGTSFATPPGDPEVFTISSSGGDVQVSIAAGSSAQDAVDSINSALSAAGVTTIQAALDDPSDPTSALTLSETRYGGNSFTVTSDSGTQSAFGLAGTHTGTNVIGTINGEAATGVGRTLTSDSGDSAGLSVLISATQSEVTGAGGTLAMGDISYTRGLTGAMEDLLDDVEGTDGSLARATGLLDGRIEDLDDRIEAFEARMELRETYLRRQFTAMETAMASLQSSASFLFSQLGQG